MGEGVSGRQFFPSSVEMSVPFGPTVIQSFWCVVVGYGGAVAVGWGLRCYPTFSGIIRENALFSPWLSGF